MASAWEEEQRRLSAQFAAMYNNSADDDGLYGDGADGGGDLEDDDDDEDIALGDSDVVPFCLPGVRPPRFGGGGGDDRALGGGPEGALPNAPSSTRDDEAAAATAVAKPAAMAAAKAAAKLAAKAAAAAAETELAADFVAKAKTLAPLVRQLLLGELAPEAVEVDGLLRALGRDKESCAQRATQKDFDVMRREGVLSADSCQRLRDAVDAQRCVAADSVDGLPEHQLKVDCDSLRALLGADEYARLMALPIEYVHMENALLGGEPVDDETAARFGRLEEAFVRRYSAGTRPWNAFHQDRARLTVNVAVSADADHGGGRLLGVYGSKVQCIERAEGEATVHSSDLFHAVTRMQSGVRYSLILFFDPDSVEDMFAARVKGVRNPRVRRFLAQAFTPATTSDSAAELAAKDLSRLLLK